MKPRRWRSGLYRSPCKRKVKCSNPSSNRPNSIKQVVIAPLTNSRHYVRVSRVLGDDHYKRMPRVTVGVARWRTLTAQWPEVPSKGQNLQPFNGNGDLSKWVKSSRVGRKTQNKHKILNIHVTKIEYTTWYCIYVNLQDIEYTSEGFSYKATLHTLYLKK